jgi:2-succinyl-5-enolpyruvyl-6-hydroxy-3-cyclohexene-1-carboxylate synthase
MTITIQSPPEISANEKFVMQVLQEVINSGVTEFCICSGSRNTPIVMALSKEPSFKQYFWFEERSAAFFALGRSKLTQRPVAVITTSGTAAGELLPATMEAYYTGIPLLLITADRPRSYRGTGAPQTAEQVGLFGIYAQFSQDVEATERCDLSSWNKDGPAHLNICLDEPLNLPFEHVESLNRNHDPVIQRKALGNPELLNAFLHTVKHPLVVVSAIKPEAREAVAKFIIQLNAPVYLEGVSGLREDARLQHLRIHRTEKIWPHPEQAGYPLDGILRIGGVPTFRLWRDLSDKKQVQVCSINDVPFSGLCGAPIIHADIAHFMEEYTPPHRLSSSLYEKWMIADRLYYQKLEALYKEEPQAEQTLFYELSRQIPMGSHIYLGNSLPIREWDLFATSENRHFTVTASRGLSGIDGQISTFLGMSSPTVSNWAILGDLTTLYDLAGPWILHQLPHHPIKLVVVNNGGGKIFSRMYPLESIQNRHDFNFRPIADMWRLHYEKVTRFPATFSEDKNLLIEVVPDDAATDRFWKKFNTL